MTEKTKNQKNLVVALSGSSGVKAIQMLLRKFYPKSSFVPTTAEKDSKKIIKKINFLFYNKRNQ